MAWSYSFIISVLVFPTIFNLVAASPSVLGASEIVSYELAEIEYGKRKHLVSKGRGVDDPICGPECDLEVNQQYCQGIIPAIGLQLSDLQERYYGKCRGYSVRNGNEVFEDQLMFACSVVEGEGRAKKYVSYGYTIFPETYGFFVYDDIGEQANGIIADENMEVRVIHYIKRFPVIRRKSTLCSCYP